MRDGGSCHHPDRARQESDGTMCFLRRLQVADWEDGVLLSQVRREDGGVQVVARAGTEAYELATDFSLYDLALQCTAGGQDLKALVLDLGLRRAVDVRALCDEGRLLPPILHPDPAHLIFTGMTCPQRERFQPATGDVLVGPGAPVTSPVNPDEGAEAGIAGICVVAPDGGSNLIGFVLANVCCDYPVHQPDSLRENHPRLRRASFGPELLVGPLPAAADGATRMRRGEEIVSEVPFRSGEETTSQSIAAHEAASLGSDILLGPGDVHVHILATARLSFAPGFALLQDDIFETEAAPFGLPLWNPLSMAAGALPLPQSIHVL